MNAAEEAPLCRHQTATSVSGHPHPPAGPLENLKNPERKTQESASEKVNAYHKEVICVKKQKMDLLTPEEVAAMLRVARKTVITMAREERIPCIRIGRFVRFDPDAIRRWIDGQRRE